MGVRVSKRRRVNYRPVIIVAAIAIPLVVAAAILVRPKPPPILAFELGPVVEQATQARGAGHARWATTVDSRGTLYYRMKSDQPYQRIATGLGREHVVALPESGGRAIELYVEVEGAGQMIKSPVLSVPARAGAASQPTR